MKNILMTAVTAFGAAFCTTLAIECLLMAVEVWIQGKKES